MLVRVSAVALNNTDLWTREGAYGRLGDPRARSGWRGPIDFPRIQGADIAGRIGAVRCGQGTNTSAVAGTLERSVRTVSATRPGPESTCR